MGDIAKLGNQRDQWEQRIRATDGDAVKAIIDRGVAWLEVYEDCRAKYGKQGGSEFSAFATERFGVDKYEASRWVAIGRDAPELLDIVQQFASDYRALYDYTRLEDDQKRALIESEETIDRKAIKAITYGHTEGDEWYTPWWLFDSLGIRYSIDVCAPIDLEHVTTPADSFFTEEENGLDQAWHGTVWCNPPYSDPSPWACRCVEHDDGLLLTHIPMNAEWCTKVWAACAGIRLFQAIEFVRPDGKTQRPGSWLQLAAFGTTAREALSQMIVPADVADNPRRVPSPMWGRVT